MKCLNLHQQLANWGLDESKIPNKTMVELGDIVENLYVLGNLWRWHVDNGGNLLTIQLLPSIGYNIF